MKYVELMQRAAFALLILTAVAGCEKDPREASKFPRQDQQGGERRISELRFVQLDNGVSVYLQEEHTDVLVSIEVLYRAGFAHEPAGQVQVAHVAEHALVHGATESYQPEQALEQLRKYGMAAAEAVATYSHFDYFVPNDKLDEALEMEAERLTSIRFDDDVFQAEAKKSAAEIDRVLNSEAGSLTKFALMAVNQVINHGATFVPVYSGTFDLSLDELAAFHDERYRPDDMVIVIMGGIDLDEAEELVRKHFGDIPRRPEPREFPTTIGGDVEATWDIDAEVVCLIFPGPYASYKDRLILAMFGSFLRGYIANSTAIQGVAKGIYVSNQVYPVGEFPFFVFGEAQASKSQAALRDQLVALTESSMDLFDEKLVERLKVNMKGFVESSMIKEANPYVPRQQYLGQEALNTGVKHIFLEGLTREEFFELVDGITLAEYQAVLNKYVSHDNMYKVSIRRR